MPHSFPCSGWSDGQFDPIKACIFPNWHCSGHVRFSLIRKTTVLELFEIHHKFPTWNYKRVAEEHQEESSDEDDDLCPIERVREFKTDDEFFSVLEKAKETDALVVVDFYHTSCGSFKRIEKGFSKFRDGSGHQQAAVIFLKHNVTDEDDEQAEVAERLQQHESVLCLS